MIVQDALNSPAIFSARQPSRKFTANALAKIARRCDSMIKDTFAAVESLMSVPRWRSLLSVPAHVQRFVQTAPERGADGLILDMEDALPQDQKGNARRQFPASMAKVGRKGHICFGANHGLRALAADLDAAVICGAARPLGGQCG
ncbi:aldolase/citrate lyase family protein [Mesorhizobium sp. M0622]|uniref:hypothetical protein n=1 Tax=Mesorhizobium sp. M0622 TaxID=2956975 RepID=UPI003338DF8B